MKIHEYQAAEILKQENLPMVPGYVAINKEEAQKAAEILKYPVVLKAQVLVGGRGKAGGIKVVKTREDLSRVFDQLKQLKIKGYSVDKIFVVQAIDIKKEFYTGMTIDNVKEDVVLIASAEGGVDIEETAKTNPDAIKKFYLQRQKNINPQDSEWKKFISSVFPEPTHQRMATQMFQSLVKAFFNRDCSLVEINPLVIDGQGKIWAADSKINFDDNAMYRHPEWFALEDPAFEDADEKEAKEKNLSFVKLDGNVGCIVNGAGLAMATMDIIQLLGGKPANFLDVGGSSNPEKVLNALKIILRNPSIKAVLINIFGGITRCDDIALGILKAREQIKIPVPLVVRLTETNEKEAKELLKQNGIETYSTMREAVVKVVELTKM